MSDMEFGGMDMATAPAAPQPEMPTAPETNFDNGPVITPDPNAPAPTEPEKKDEEPKQKEAFDWRSVLKSTPTISYTGAMPGQATEDLYSLNAASRGNAGDSLRTSLEKQYGSYGTIFHNVLNGMGYGSSNK